MPNYLEHYHKLCTSRQQLTRHKQDGYFESHHIIPKSLGGTNDSDNLVLLTAREHYIAHLLLYYHYKQIGGSDFRKMSYALVSMASTNKNLQRISLSSRQYSIIREAAMFSRKGHKVENTSNYKQPKSESHKESIRKARLSAPRRSQQTCEKISKNLKGRINTQNFILAKCPHCMFEGQKVAMKRWHFDNCKQNKKGIRYA
jgi:hypothetical protein